MKCENCDKEQRLGETFWTSRKTGKALMVCAKCLFKLDGSDLRGKSLGNVLKELERKRRDEK